MFLPLHDQNNEPVQATPVVSYVLMTITVLVYCYQFLIGLGDAEESLRFSLRHGLVPAPFLSGKTDYECVIPLDKPSPGRRPGRSSRAEEEPGEVEGPSELRFQISNTAAGLWLMPLTYIFLHGGWMHLLGNLWFFWIFSDNVEERMGRPLFLLFYLAAGVGGGILHMLLRLESNLPLVGASGAISGLMGAYIILFPGNRITTYFCPVWFFIRRLDVPSWMVLGFFILFNIFAMSQATLSGGSQVAFDCHVGGFMAGLLAGWFFRDAAPAKPRVPA
ncbi:MAG: rhomboid family intramembrane serine protease [Candidatus Riflebacteria bacterium]|nr:rhomboid family intramembrane serine protease [Candidatus Riflebacteria bacterium]